MKKIIAVLAIIVLLSACTSRTEYGECIGITDKEKPGLVYKVSAWNVALAILFFELILPPVFVLVDEFKCPVAKQ